MANEMSFKSRSARVLSTLGLALLGTTGPCGCVRSSAGLEPTKEAQCAGDPLDDSAALPDSRWIRLRVGVIEKISPTGRLAWSANSPGREPLLQGFSVAANSTVYVRDNQHLRALGGDGKWLWERAAPITGPVDQSHGPVAMPDSGVVLRIGAKDYRSYGHDGTLRWTAEVRLTSPVTHKPLVLPNGATVVAGSEDFAIITPDGLVQ